MSETKWTKGQAEILQRIGRNGSTVVPIHAHLVARAEERRAASELIALGIIELYDARPLTSKGKPDRRLTPMHRLRATEQGKPIADQVWRGRMT